MKSRQSSPQPELVRMRTFRLDSTNDPPRVQLNEVGFSPSMNFHSPSSLFSDPGSPRQPAPSPTPAPRAASRTANHTSSEQDTPTRQTRPTALSRVTSPQPFDHDTSIMSPTRDSSMPGTPASESEPTWSSAVGRATVGGKSGRVIEQLQAVNDKLKRDIKLSEAKLEEQIRTAESARSVQGSIQASHDNLQTIVESLNGQMDRRERQIKEMKVDLESERTRRVRAERQMKEIADERDTFVQEHNQSMAHEKEVAAKATSAYEVMSISWSHREDTHTRQIRKLQAEIEALRANEQAHKERFAAMEVVTAQLRADGDGVRANYKKVLNEFEEYKAVKEESMRGIVERAKRNDEVNDGTAGEMNSVLKEMKYIMNLKKVVEDME